MQLTEKTITPKSIRAVDTKEFSESRESSLYEINKRLEQISVTLKTIESAHKAHQLISPGPKSNTFSELKHQVNKLLQKEVKNLGLRTLSVIFVFTGVLFLFLALGEAISQFGNFSETAVLSVMTLITTGYAVFTIFTAKLKFTKPSTQTNQ